MCWQKEVINEIDNIIYLILGSDKWAEYAEKLKEHFLNGFADMQKKAIKEAIEYIEQTNGNLTDQDFIDFLATIQDRLGDPLAQLLRDEVVSTQKNCYKVSFEDAGKTTSKDIKIEFSFNQVSKDALKWMEENQSYWIGNYFKDQLSDKLGTALEDAKKKIFDEGLGRAEAGKVLYDTCNNFFDTPEGYKGKIKNYWEGLATHIVTQSREFGHIDAFERAEIDFVKIVAVMDARTSKICKHLSGRVMPVAHLKEIRNKIINSKSPEEAKQYSPWLTDKQVEENVKGKSTLQLLTSPLTKYIGPPPYHFFCRSILVPATKEEFESQVLAA